MEEGESGAAGRMEQYAEGVNDKAARREDIDVVGVLCVGGDDEDEQQHHLATLVCLAQPSLRRL